MIIRHDYKKADAVWKRICDELETARYYSKTELQIMRRQFLMDFTRGDVKTYIELLQNEISNRRPATLYGCYDFDGERVLDALILDLKRGCKPMYATRCNKCSNNEYFNLKYRNGSYNSACPVCGTRYDYIV